MMRDFQLKIFDDYYISIENVKRLVSNFFGKEKYVLHYKNLKLYLNEKITFCIKLWSVKMTKTTHRLYYTKIKEAEKNDNKNGKSPCKLLDNAIYGKVMESMKNKLM